MFDLLIQGGRVVDGTGAPWRRADVGIVNGRIVAVGALGDRPATTCVYAGDRIVSPGFIDIHTHTDLTVLADRWTDARLRQGITTEVVGQDGIAYAPVSGARLQEWRRWLIGLNGDFPEIVWDWQSVDDLLVRYHGLAANVVCLIPHGAVRVEAMGWDARPASKDELRTMADLVRKSMAEGAAGLSTGLTYAPCLSATTDEMVAICRPVAEAGGIYATHLRSYGAQFMDAIDEAVEIGRHSGVAVQISHLRVADPDNRGMAGAIMARLDNARAAGIDITYDAYPYTAGCAPLYSLTPDWVRGGEPDEVLARLGDAKLLARMAGEMADWGLDWSWYTLSNTGTTASHNWQGRSIPDAAAASGLTAPEFVLRLLRETELDATIISGGGSLPDTDALFQHPAGMLCSDGVMMGTHPHPRGYGAFPRFLGDYVRERGLLSLEDAVYRMTGLPAARLNLSDRGQIREGSAADLVVFSPDRVGSQADFDHGRREPEGIDWVFVNGRAVVADGDYVGGQHGEALRVG